ncbi:MAG: DUF2029 domain-containing protein [candidate division Zixibacteria bacterium]|nr:DUF2029 domain-containing protein [candidate division Zixibacteria bacterium]
MLRLNEKTIRWITVSVCLAVCVYAVIVFYNVIAGDKQWDFRTYYFAAQAHSQGVDPYDTENLRALADREISLAYVYPPLTLYAFRPFLLFSFETAYQLFFFLKLAALAVLIYIWYTRFLSDKRFTVVLCLLCAFAFRETIIRDLYAGNVSVFEQLMLWAAALFFVEKKSLAYCVLIGITALFKFTFVILLFAVLLDRDRKAVLSFVTVGAAFVVVTLISFLGNPTLFEGFVANVASLSEGIPINQASLTLIRDVLRLISDMTGGEFVRLDSAFHIAFVLFLLIFSFRSVSGYDFRNNRTDFIILCFFLYALLMPRMKDYSYVLLIIPCLHVTYRMLGTGLARLLAVFFLCVSFLPYQAFLTALILYLVFIRQIRRGAPAL